MINYNPDKADVNNSSYVSGSQTVTTTAAEARVGGSALSGRQWIYIENLSTRRVYYGPSGVTSSTGAELRRNEHVFLNHGPDNPVFVITASGTANIRVQESS